MLNKNERVSTGRPIVADLIYGENIYNWWLAPGAKPGNAEVVYRGYNQTTAGANYDAVLYHYAWENLRPGIPLESIDFISSETVCSPFVAAITVE